MPVVRKIMSGRESCPSSVWAIVSIVQYVHFAHMQFPCMQSRVYLMSDKCTISRLGRKIKIKCCHFLLRQEIVALSGAHALGRCHRRHSGFDGPWTHSPITFSNDYFKLLLEEKWCACNTSYSCCHPICCLVLQRCALVLSAVRDKVRLVAYTAAIRRFSSKPVPDSIVQLAFSCISWH
jgi:hypothetical protein